MPEIHTPAVKLIDQELEAATREAWALAAHRDMTQHSGLRRLMGHLYRLGLAIEQVKAPPLLAPNLSVDLSKMIRPGPVIFAENPPKTGPSPSVLPEKDEIRSTGEFAFRPRTQADLETDLEDVLDSFRLIGRPCGVQVLAINQVCCWIGDLPQEFSGAHWRAWGGNPDPALFHLTRGANALEDAAKWLRHQLESATLSPIADAEAQPRG